MKFALIGKNIQGSGSPALFESFSGGKHDYELLDYPDFESAWQAFLDGPYAGINVTAPFKEKAFENCLALSSDARAAGAVNLVLKDGLRGFNTDVDGIRSSVAEAGITPSEVLVVGTGGAARAALAAYRGLRMSVIGRNPSKVAALTAEFGLEQGFVNPDLIVYTLPGAAPVPPGLPLSTAALLEAEYKKPALESAGCKLYISGRRWLYYQALGSYGIFTSRPLEGLQG